MKRAYLLLLVPLAATSHPQHASSTEMHRREACHCFEVTLQLNTEDLEVTLARQRGGTRLPLETDAVDADLRNYLKQHFQVRDESGTNQPISWVGKEIAAGNTWLYFTMPVKAPEMTLRNTVLLEAEPSQINLVQIRGIKAQQVLRFDARNAALWQVIRGD